MDLPQNLIATTIHRGTVLFSKEFEKTAIGHGKFFVVMGVYGDVIAGCFFINSWINTFTLRQQEQLEMQFPIEPVDYPFLEHRSYINATSIERIKKEVLVGQLSGGTAKICGEIAQPQLNTILAKCRESRLFSRIEKKQFFE